MAVPVMRSYVKNIDYIVDEQNSRAGIIKIPKGSRIRQGDDVLVSCAVPDRDLHVVSGGSNHGITGKLLYVPDNVSGPNYVLEAWKVQIKPDGDLTGLISSGEFGTYKIDFVFITDYEHHPSTPYYSMTLIDYAKDVGRNSGRYNAEY